LKTRNFVVAATFFAIGALVACKGGGASKDGEGGAGAAAGVKASCNQIPLLGTCTEYPKGLTFALAETACTMIPDAGSVWGKDKCPEDRVVGKCIDAAKDALYENETEIYYAPFYTPDSAKKECVEDPIRKGKTYAAVDFKPKDGEARGACTRKTIGSKNTGPDECEEYPYTTSKEDWTIVKMNCSGESDKLEIGKTCTKDTAVSKCETKDGSVLYYFPHEAKNQKDSCESPPSSGKYTKLGGAAVTAATTTPVRHAPAGSGRPTAPKPSH
jgi:hypothetical protein